MYHLQFFFYSHFCNIVHHRLKNNKIVSKSLNWFEEEKSKMSFGQIVAGPPGSGKSTYCKGMKEFLVELGRETVIVNLDPANTFLMY